MSSVLSFPPPQSSLLPRQRSSPLPPRPTSLRLRHFASSPQAPNPVVVPEEDSLALEEAAAAPRIVDDSQFRGCKTCGKEEIEQGCNGEGRIQGGIAIVPGFGWWPIKAFRPCPGFVASGGRYRRRGQNMDEVAFGRGKVDSSMGSTVSTKSSKRGQGPKKLKG